MAIYDTDIGLKASGFYRGTVKKHLSNGRCKIYIPSIYNEQYETDFDKLPDAEQASPLFGGANYGNGVFSYPHLGATVWCFFENEDINRPVYFASTLGGLGNQAQFKEARPKVTDSDVKNGTDAYIHKIKVDKCHVTLNQAGIIKIITFGKDKNSKDEASISIDGSGNISINATNRIQLTAPQIKLSASDICEINSNVYVCNASTLHQTDANDIVLDASTNGGRVVIKGKNSSKQID